MKTPPAGKQKRKVELVVLSDIHLGTYGCHAKELYRYMKSIRPKAVVLNGDIIDMWQFSKNYFPKDHLSVLHRLFKWINKGIPVYYLPGNHDENLRRFVGFKMGSLAIENKLVMDLNGKKTWIFHGDVFDVTMQHSKWLARLGAIGYDTLILINSFCNWILTKTGRGKISFSKTIKNSVKQAVSFINHFEQLCADIASESGYDTVICGHIHQPEIREMQGEKGPVTYMNSGDWIENLTSLEYNDGKWSLFKYDEKDFEASHEETETEEAEQLPDEKLVFMKNKEIFTLMATEFGMKMDR
ncbi:MAG TPA: UDP-2,3-diacylglucosamine diphosphatase [Bacteroidia bacterium]|nr:UDP-2,3-diacylglucosamine diphosphatase [Bacteroidia bacterium]